MDLQLLSDDQLRLGMRGILTRNPYASISEAITSWKVQYGSAMDDALLQRLMRAYEDERLSLGPPPPRPRPARPDRGDGTSFVGHVANVALGLAWVFLGLSLAFGPQVGALMFGFAIVCTAGVSLVIIIPVCWALGLATRYLVRSVMSTLREESA